MGTTVASLPVAVVVGSAITIGVLVNIAYEENLFGMKDFAKDFGELVDNMIKGIENFIRGLFR